MGTLHNQPGRNYKRISDEDISQFIEDVQNFVAGSDLSADQVLKCYEIKELQRRNDLFAANGDIWDEQISGIGECLDRISNAIEEINEKP